MSLNYKEDGELKPLAKTEVIKDIYSTEEIVVGEWVDGKPIYRRVFNGSWTATTSTWTNTDIPSATMETLVVSLCKRRSADSAIAFIQVSVDNSNVVQLNSITGTYTITQLILEYTKTTD